MNNKSVNKIALMILFGGIVVLLFGYYATEQRLISFATEYISPDKSLSEYGINAIQELRSNITLAGVLLFLLAALIKFQRYLLRLLSFMEPYLLKVRDYFASLLKKLYCNLYNILTHENFAWFFIIFLIFAFEIPAIILGDMGGYHVEGIDLVPAKNLVRHGIYGTLTTEGFNELTYRTSAGPGVIMLQALVFKLFGINIYYARALQLVFFIPLLILWYLIGRSIYGKNVALLSMVILSASIVSYGNMASECYRPAFVYLLAGIYFWFRAVDDKKTLLLVASGIFLGLAFHTKLIYLHGLFAVCLTWLILRFTEKQLEHRYWVLPVFMVIAVTIAWNVFRLWNLGSSQYYVHVKNFFIEHLYRGVGTVAFKGILPEFLAYRPLVNLSQVDFWSGLQLFLLIPALIYAIKRMVSSKAIDYKILYLVSFVMIWLNWWLFFNYDGFNLHLNPMRFISYLFIGKLLYDLWHYSGTEKRNVFNSSNPEKGDIATLSTGLRAMVAMIIITSVGVNLSEKVNELYLVRSKLRIASDDLKEYVKTNTEKNAVFSGWEWSMPWYLDLDEADDRPLKDRANYPQEQREAVPEYFVVSAEWPLEPVGEYPDTAPWNVPGYRQVNQMRAEFLENHTSLVKRFVAGKHEWLLYKVNNYNLQK